MRLNKLSLRDFRNYGEATVNLDPGVNLIVGDNAQGKTNLLEAVSYLGSGRSFRAQKNSEMIRFGAEFGEIYGEVHSQDRDQTLRWLLFPGRRQIFRNGAKKRTAGELSGVLQTVLFCPEDLGVLRAGASGRRRLADNALCQLRPNYDAALAEYGRILEQKSRILKDRIENPALLISYRARFFEALGKAAKDYHAEFSGGSEEFTLEYQTVSTVKDPFASLSQLEADLQAHLESHRRAELDSGQCLTGPHKDDFLCCLSGIPLKSYGSQGQVRTAAISLKLAQRELMERECGETPVLLLDDVLSELDPGRQDFVLNKIRTGQVFITCCEQERFTRLGKSIEIQKGSVVGEK